MAKFYGKVQGDKGESTKCGHHTITAIAASWRGAVQTTLHERGGVTYARVELMPWQGVGVSRVVYDGPVDAPQ